jgi:HSP20 family protein
VEPDKAQASFSNGVLTVTIPRKEGDVDSVRRIPINKN